LIDAVASGARFDARRITTVPAKVDAGFASGNREAKKPFWRLKDVVHQPGYFVAKDLKMMSISSALAPHIQADGLTPLRPY